VKSATLDGSQKKSLSDPYDPIAHAVEFHHDISEQEGVYALLKAERVCVFPSAREGFGIAVVGALACGAPVITTSARDNLAQHLVARSQRGTVCEPSAPAIADAVKTLFKDREASDEPSIPDEWLRESSWDTIAYQVAEALQV
jgi:glycosyltransferase involved in cell wall biosynthesis